MTNYNQKENALEEITPPTICSLRDLDVAIPEDIRHHLSQQYLPQYSHKEEENNDNVDDPQDSAGKHLDQILEAMKVPPANSVCRVNLIQGSRDDAQRELEQELKQQHLEQFAVIPHSEFSDVLCVELKEAHKESNGRGQDATKRLAKKGPAHSTDQESLFGSWPKRLKFGWPMTHRVVIVDRLCGEAVLRGSHIFVKGILSADVGIQKEDTVAVYADVGPTTSKRAKLPRGLLLEHYTGRRCVYLGLGVSCYKRADLFRLNKGVGIQMSLHPDDRPGPLLPPISGLLPSKLYFQNMPSIVVAHALDPQPGEVIIDMCAAPGGKTCHLASLVKNNATIIACDRSRKKMVSVKATLEQMGATCVHPLALDSTGCVTRDNHSESGESHWKSVQEVLQTASKGADGLLNVSKFYPESFDRVLLDPPCSALGLRPKLRVMHTTLDELQRMALYQRKFVQEAFTLLKPGGTMTYSTCTFHADENERMVQYILSNYPMLELVPILPTATSLGRVGLEGMGLSEEERTFVRRFDPLPNNPACDTIGFFVAKFRKKL